LRRQVLAERRERFLHGGAIVAQRRSLRESRPVNIAPTMTTAPGVSDTADPRPGVAPACPLFGACGGCQYQPLAYEDQLALKTDAVRRLFAPLAADVAACVPCPAPYGYRSKLTPHFARPRPDRERAIGFLRGDRRVTIDVTACPIAT